MDDFSITTSTKKLIASGNIDKALNLIENYLVKNNIPDLRDEIILLSSQYNTYEKKQRLGLKPNKSDLNAISFALIEIVNKLESNETHSLGLKEIATIASEEYNSFKIKKIKKLSLASGGAVSIGLLLFLLGMNTAFLALISTALIIIIYILLDS